MIIQISQCWLVDDLHLVHLLFIAVINHFHDSKLNIKLHTYADCCNVTGGEEEYHEQCEIKPTADFVFI